MKRILTSLLILATLLAVSSCEENTWIDSYTPVVYIPNYGLSVNDVWCQTGSTASVGIGVYCSGIRKENVGEPIQVGFTVDPTLIDTYNNDVTQLYSGLVEALPSNYYSITGTSVTIESGANSASIPVTIQWESLKEYSMDPDKYYVIPIRLISTSQYSLSEDESMNWTMYAVNLRNPNFYFYVNHDGQVLQSKKVITGENSTDKFVVGQVGVPDGEYKLEAYYDAEALAEAYPYVKPLPKVNAIFDQSNLVYRSPSNPGYLTVRYDPDGLAYQTSYYLPISLKGSTYGTDSEKKTVFVLVQKKNEYDKTYDSALTITSESVGRTNDYTATKELVSVDDDIVELQVITNSTIAGVNAGSSSTSSSTYNDLKIKIRIIPTSDPTHYKVEYIHSSTIKNLFPSTFEPDPDNESYYDWYAQRFHLYYRWQHVDGKYITVSEQLTPSA